MQKRFSRLLTLLLLSILVISRGHADSKKYRVAYIVPDGTTYFWRAVHAGAIKAQKECADEQIDLELLWIPTHDANSLPEEISLLGDAVGSNVDGIAVCPLDPHALVPTVELAVRQKIPVISVDQTLDYPLITSIVATSNYECGAEAAIIAGKLIHEHGTVLLIRNTPSNADTVKRENGFLDGIRRYFDGILIDAPDQNSGGTEAGAYQLTQKLLQTYGTQIAAIFTPDPVTTRGAHRALKDLGLSDHIKHVGYLLGDEATAALQSGDYQGLIVPDPFNLGYLSLRTVIESIKGRQVRPRVEVPEAAISPDNLNDPGVQAVLNPPIEQYLPSK